MSWTDQDPPATDVLLEGRVVTSRGDTIHFEIDRVPDGVEDHIAKYRITVGNLFGSQQICRMSNLEDALRSFSMIVNKAM